MTSANDIWAAAYGSAFANVVETVFNSQVGIPEAERETRPVIAQKIRIEAAKEAQEVATEAMRGLLEVQEAQMSPEERADWQALAKEVDG